VALVIVFYMHVVHCSYWLRVSAFPAGWVISIINKHLLVERGRGPARLYNLITCLMFSFCLLLIAVTSPDVSRSLAMRKPRVWAPSWAPLPCPRWSSCRWWSSTGTRWTGASSWPCSSPRQWSSSPCFSFRCWLPGLWITPVEDWWPFSAPRATTSPSATP